MLTYHPALDPYHSAFRILRILLSIEAQSIEVDKVRILEFLLAFPQTLKDMRLPKGVGSRVKKLALSDNNYTLPTNPRLIFIKITPLQEQAIKLLVSTRLLEFEDAGHQVVRKLLSGVPPKLQAVAIRKNTRDESLVRILAHDIAPISLLGQSGLKARTGLMEYRYDPT